MHNYITGFSLPEQSAEVDISPPTPISPPPAPTQPAVSQPQPEAIAATPDPPVARHRIRAGGL